LLQSHTSVSKKDTWTPASPKETSQQCHRICHRNYLTCLYIRTGHGSNLVRNGQLSLFIKCKKKNNFAFDCERSNGPSGKFLEKVNYCCLLKKDSIAFCQLFCNTPWNGLLPSTLRRLFAVNPSAWSDEHCSS
jgi:hypothetical protein